MVERMLFDGEEQEKQIRVDAVADWIRERFGVGAKGRDNELDLGRKRSLAS